MAAVLASTGEGANAREGVVRGDQQPTPAQTGGITRASAGGCAKLPQSTVLARPCGILFAGLNSAKTTRLVSHPGEFGRADGLSLAFVCLMLEGRGERV